MALGDGQEGSRRSPQDDRGLQPRRLSFRLCASETGSKNDARNWKQKAVTRCRARQRKSGEASEKLSARLQEVRALAARLLAPLPVDESRMDWKNTERAGCSPRCWNGIAERKSRLGGNTSGFASYPTRNSKRTGTRLGGLAYVGAVDHIKRSIIHRYSFPPQDHAIDRAHEVHDPRTGIAQGRS